ncbi:putative protein N(5)-glutamine methyltransferase [Plantactinospora sp. CA-290183]|uniref:putative protein N(5)-glutamine methyltransferase n=1 Tax=Plantactinospora sp. CA-290183 TaxID=3240006 RepID=UPI003D93CC81
MPITGDPDPAGPAPVELPGVDPATVVARLRGAGCVYAEEEAELLLAGACTSEALVAMVERRVAGLPLEQVLGWAEFCGLRVAVEVGVFVPRRRTELLVRRAVALAGSRPTVVDLCCGSGALALAVAASVPPARLVAVDIDPAAVRCAAGNLAPRHAEVFLGDLFEPLPADLRGGVDLLLANVPYVPTEVLALLPAEARLHEPPVALDGGTDGLDVLRRVAAGAGEWLADGGHLLVEVGDDQVAAAVEVLGRHGLTAEVVHDPDLDATVLSGRAG